MNAQPSGKSDATVRLGACQCQLKKGGSEILRFVMKKKEFDTCGVTDWVLLREPAKNRNGEWVSGWTGWLKSKWSVL